MKNLTFKSTATIVAKEGSSMGAGAQKITTDVTGNDTAGMVAGMVTSGVTAKWRDWGLCNKRWVLSDVC